MADELGPGNAFLAQQLYSNEAILALLGSEPDFDFIDEAGSDGSGNEIDPYPILVVSNVSGGNDSLGMGAERILAEPLYLVMVTGHEGYAQIGRIYSLADDLLHQQQATVTVDGVDYDVSCFRERGVQPPGRAENGERFVRRGGYYRLHIQLL